MTNIIAVLIVVIILALAIAYICKAKKNGQACIGCSESGNCAAKKNSCGCSWCDVEDKTTL